MNRILYPDTWAKSRRNSLALQRIGTAAIMLQIKQHRYFIAEQPVGSEGYEIREWQQICNENTIYFAKIDQCMAGKIGRTTGLPIKKPTEFRSNSDKLIAGLRRFQCDGSHQHAQLGGGGRMSPGPVEKPGDHAEWPPGVVQALAK